MLQQPQICLQLWHRCFFCEFCEISLKTSGRLLLADDNTPYTFDISLNLVLEKLESPTHDLFRCFKENHTKGNPDKCHLLLTTNALTSVNINGFEISNSTEEKLLVTRFKSKLSFENHVSNLCKKASQRLNALTRIVNY